MPIYEYHCNDCKTDFEQLVFSSSQADKVPCSKCGSRNVERKVSSVASAGSSSSSSAAAAYSSCGSGGFS